MTDHAAVLFANDAFYTAFGARDYDVMDEVWSSRLEVSCVHPGWQPLTGRDAVMQSWRAILANPDCPQIDCQHPRVYVHGGVAYVICFELIDRSCLAATNVFVREDRRWRMVHHHAGIAPEPEAPDAPPPPLQ